MLNTFRFENTSNQSPNDRNWQIFDLGSKTSVKTDLVFVNEVNNPVIEKGIFVLYGPIVFFNIEFSMASGDGWDLTTYIKMPFKQLNVAGTLQFESSFTVLTPADGSIYGQAYMATEENLMFNTSYAAAGAEQARIQGWYFRN